MESGKSKVPGVHSWQGLSKTLKIVLKYIWNRFKSSSKLSFCHCFWYQWVWLNPWRHSNTANIRFYISGQSDICGCHWRNLMVIGKDITLTSTECYYSNHNTTQYHITSPQILHIYTHIYIYIIHTFTIIIKKNIYSIRKEFLLKHIHR